MTDVSSSKPLVNAVPVAVILAFQDVLVGGMEVEQRDLGLDVIYLEGGRNVIQVIPGIILSKSFKTKSDNEIAAIAKRSRLPIPVCTSYCLCVFSDIAKTFYDK